MFSPTSVFQGSFSAASIAFQIGDRPAIGNFALNHNGEMHQELLTTDDENCLVIAEAANGISVLYPDHFLMWDDASAFLAEDLQKPVFSFHIHDGDLWMYVLFSNSGIVDRFNPMPDYWGKIEDGERQLWRGDAEKVSKFVGVRPDSISRYLMRWNEAILTGREREKAYPDDEHFYGSDWQLLDFLKRLGLCYPVDDHGSPIGTTYRFRCKIRRGRARSE